MRLARDRTVPKWEKNQPTGPEFQLRSQILNEEDTLKHVRGHNPDPLQLHVNI